MSTTPEDLVLDSLATPVSALIRVTGIVQGVGFRPTVWRIATDLNIAGSVCNDGRGVLIRVGAVRSQIDALVDELKSNPPPLARIDTVNVRETNDSIPPSSNGGFEIEASHQTQAQTAVTPDAATCNECLKDTLGPFGRRYRYPLTNCTHCGPRFSIVYAIPYDRPKTSMAPFTLCEPCLSEYTSPADRRFHAQPNACYDCGPRVTLSRLDQQPVCLETLSQLDDCDAACTVLQNGHVMLIKGTGGYHLACDATNHAAVKRLREVKARDVKPFALMARDLEVIKRYVTVSQEEEHLIQSSEAPIVLLPKPLDGPSGVCKKFGVPGGARPLDLTPMSNDIAPGCNTLGFMLPNTPMHHLILKRMNRPIVLTSANVADHPQFINDQAVIDEFSDKVEYVLSHDRAIVNRVDDSLTRVMKGEPRVIRRARGYAPAPLPLPPGFEKSPELLAMGGELKNTFCLTMNGDAIVSQHIGDLENATTNLDYQKNMALYADLFQHTPKCVVVDAHPEYISTKLGRKKAESDMLPMQTVQHHHAHIASCMAENNWPLSAGPVLGVALDGLGYGADDALWGGEFLLADYQQAERLGHFKPVAMLGGAKAVKEPWRNTYAHLMAELGWNELAMNYSGLELVQFLQRKPLDTLNAMLTKQVHAPLASSCGRLFDAVAGAVGVCRESTYYEGQAALELEALVDQHTLYNESEFLSYPFSIPMMEQKPYIEPLAMWQALLGDLILDTPVPVMAARFHKGLANVIVKMVERLSSQDEERIVNTVALSGGVFQNRILFESVVKQLENQNFEVLTHRHVPANDGGLSLGQAVIGAARIMNNSGVKECA